MRNGTLNLMKIFMRIVRQGVRQVYVVQSSNMERYKRIHVFRAAIGRYKGLPVERPSIDRILNVKPIAMQIARYGVQIPRNGKHWRLANRNCNSFPGQIIITFDSTSWKYVKAIKSICKLCLEKQFSIFIPAYPILPTENFVHQDRKST